MNICIPINEDQGLQSTVCAHFGSAPMFLLVDTETREFQPLQNDNDHHAHGMCQPLRALQGHQVDALVVAGIGMGALSRLQAAGIEVFKATHPTVAETLEALTRGELLPIDRRGACGGHGGGCHH